ncbi:MAG: sigma-70 family RNA polymerase sigma factor [Candidatus Sumerlaeia bacterium]|nr:sigma-70 family RNA polymerase sigma factor [Candidatus Sumerlaeia bacterium]
MTQLAEPVENTAVETDEAPPPGTERPRGGVPGTLAGEDGPLVAAAQAGDLSAFDTLIRRHQDRVYNQAWRLLGDHDEASDLAQEVFIRVFRKIHLYRGDAAFSTWLYRVTSNLAKNRWKQMERKGRSKTVSLDQPRPDDDDDRPLDKPDAAPSPRQQAEGRELLGHLEQELLGLGYEHREVLVLRFVENLSYEEIAEVLDANLGTVKSRICRARQELRRRMDPYLGEE